MRCRRCRQAERAAQPRHRLLHQLGLKPPAAHADEERIARRQPVRAGREIVCDCIGDDGQHRDHPLLAALSGNHEAALSAALSRHIGAIQPQRLADAEPAAVEQQQHRDIPAGGPVGWPAASPVQVDDGLGLALGERPRYAARRLRRAHQGERGGHGNALAFQMAEEDAHSRERPRRGGLRVAFPRPAREPGAHVPHAERTERREVGRGTPVLRQKAQEVVEVAPVGGDGVVGAPPLVGEAAEPGLHRRRQVGCGR